jgi:hypothetical protein
MKALESSWPRAGAKTWIGSTGALEKLAKPLSRRFGNDACAQVRLLSRNAGSAIVQAAVSTYAVVDAALAVANLDRAAIADGKQRVRESCSPLESHARVGVNRCSGSRSVFIWASPLCL